MPREPLKVGRFVIHGHGQGDSVGAGEVGIEIEAGMAFGSGEHASTMGCLLALDHLIDRRRVSRVLDLGCGSAILAIAAARSGRRSVVASDNDPIAVRVAAENARRNRVGRDVTAVLADGYRHHVIRGKAPFDLIFANILADPLCAMAPALRRHLAPGGHAILAGLLDSQAPAVIDVHRGQGLRLVDQIDLAPWTTLVFKRPRR